MPEYVLNRNHTLRTINGVISFKKGEPTWVPPHMERDALNIGADPVDGEKPSQIDDEKKDETEQDVEKRKAAILVAFEKIYTDNDPADFTGQGVPTVKSVEKLAGMNVTRDEVVEYWADFKLEKTGGQE